MTLYDYLIVVLPALILARSFVMLSTDGKQQNFYYYFDHIILWYATMISENSK